MTLSTHSITGQSSLYRAILVISPWVVLAGAVVGSVVSGGLPWWAFLIALTFVPVPHWIFARMPDEIRVTDHGLTFMARLRTVEVLWDELVEIKTCSNPMWLKWRWSGGSIVTHSQLTDRAELLRAAERRSLNLRSTP